MRPSYFSTVLLPLLSYPNKFETYLGGWSTALDPDDKVRTPTTNLLHAEVAAMNAENFIVRMHLQPVLRFQDRAAWDSLLSTKHRGVNVPLPAADRSVLLDWLSDRFSLTTTPFPRTYVAQEITTFFSDAEAEALLTRACTSCHEPDRFNNARFNPDRWRVVIVDMRERGAKLEDEELERLVEWLGRTKGANQ